MKNCDHIEKYVCVCKQNKYICIQLRNYFFNIPPMSHIVICNFLYWIVSTLNPMVGIVVTTSPSLSLYVIVVFPVILLSYL